MNKNGGEKQGNPNRIVVIGVDSADFYLVQEWVSEGYLPAMASLIARGCWGKLNSTADIGSGTVWPSFFTGSSPAKHRGLHLHGRRIKPGTYRLAYFPPRANLLKREPFWLQLSLAGKRIAVLDVPMTYPIEGLNGIQLVGWGAHSPQWRPDSWPPEIINDVISSYGSNPAADDDEFTPKTLDELSNFYTALTAGIEKKGLISRSFLDKEAWDLLITVFAESHCVGHNFWHLTDENHPEYDSESAKTLGDSIFNVYSLIDSEMSRIIDSAPDATFFIVSTEGMGASYTGSHLLPEILRRLGMGPEEISLDNNLSKRFKISAKRLRQLMPSVRWGPDASMRNIKGKLPVSLVKAIELGKRLVPQDTWHSLKCYLSSLGNDWRWSRAFPLPSDFNGAIRINLKGREPEGRVEPGAEYEALCDELIEEISKLINVDTGKMAVSKVIRVDRIHKGEYLDELPDIVVRWTSDAPIRGLYSPRIGTVTGETNPHRTGAHRPYGFLIASGKHIARGRTLKEEPNIMDIAPTILYLMGQAIPSDMDGKVLLDMVQDEFKFKNPVRSM
jgi:predicted AlkP superfamily phosphohydrolase/phosphomutase